MISRALFFVLFSLLIAPAQAATGRFCVQTFNVYGTAYASNVSSRLTRLADELVADPCAANLFQELWQADDYLAFTRRLAPARFATLHADPVRGDDKLAGLAGAFSGSVLSARAALYAVNNQGGFLDWFRDMAGVQKGYLRLDVSLEGGAPPMTYVSTHTHPTDQAVRLAQMVQLTSSLMEGPQAADRPLFFAGDLNARPEEISVRLLTDVLLLKDSFFEANRSYRGICTYCAANPLSWDSDDRVIDFVLYRSAPGLRLAVEKSEINLRGTAAAPLSDHYGVRSSFTWEAEHTIPLPIDAPLVQARIAKARATLREAKEVLKRDGREELLPAYEFVRALKALLDEGRLPEGLAAAYLLP
jgi:hypothetical protein